MISGNLLPHSEMNCQEKDFVRKLAIMESNQRIARLEEAYDSIHGQITAMLHRSEKYQKEAEDDNDLVEGEKHSRVSSVLRELDRLAIAFRKRADMLK